MAYANRKSYKAVKISGTPGYNSPYRTSADPVLGSIFILVVIAIVLAVSSHPEWFIQ
jgi:hypothetical protein